MENKRKRGPAPNLEKGLSALKGKAVSGKTLYKKCLFCEFDISALPKKRGNRQIICSKAECEKKRNAAYQVDYRQGTFQILNVEVENNGAY